VTDAETTLVTRPVTEVCSEPSDPHAVPSNAGSAADISNTVSVT